MNLRKIRSQIRIDRWGQIYRIFLPESDVLELRRLLSLGAGDDIFFRFVAGLRPVPRLSKAGRLYEGERLPSIKGN